MRPSILTALAVLAAGTAVAADAPPSFVVLVTDDQRADCLSCAGHPLLKTPNVDRLAAEGVRFPNAFVTTSICCVSRACLVTGRIARHHNVGDFRTALKPEYLANSFPALLKKAGYRTGAIGKWGIGGEEPKEVFDFWDAWGGQGDHFLKVNGERVHNSQYLADRAAEFFRGCEPGKPFCLVVYFKAPHDPLQPDPRDAGLFRGEKPPLAATATEDQFKRLPPFLQHSLNRQWAERDLPTPEKRDEHIRQYLRLIAGVDRAVGRIVGSLDDTGLRKQTVIAYTSDNGMFLGEHGLIGKWTMHEESIRVPMIFSGPPLPAATRGKTPPEMVLNVDIAPTLLDLAGVAAPAGIDGKSLRPLLEGKADGWRKDFFYEHHYQTGLPQQWPIARTEGVRTADWKYITYPDAEPAYEELYDLRKDPGETTNLATDAGHADRLKTMRELYRERTKGLPPPVLTSVPPKKT